MLFLSQFYLNRFYIVRGCVSVSCVLACVSISKNGISDAIITPLS